MRYTIVDYRNALNERDSHDLETPGWKLGQMKVDSIVEEMMKAGSKEMAYELVDGIWSLIECGFELQSEEIEKLMDLLKNNGFEDMALEIWEEMEA